MDKSRFKAFLMLIFLATVGIIFVNVSLSDSHRFYFKIQRNNDKNGSIENCLNKSTSNMRVNIPKVHDFSDAYKWSILLTINLGFLNLFENWWWYFKKLKIKVNVILLAEDDIAFEKLIKQYDDKNISVVRSWKLNTSRPLRFASHLYNKMMSVRPTYLLRFLEDGHNVLYSDIDSVWLQNPFPYFKGVFDIWAQTQEGGRKVCAGFVAIRNNNRTTELVKRWEQELQRRLQRNQPVFNTLIKQLNVSVGSLDEYLFIGGPQASSMTQEQRNRVAMVHATFCKGYAEKVACFEKWNLWYASHNKTDVS